MAVYELSLPTGATKVAFPFSSVVTVWIILSGSPVTKMLTCLPGDGTPPTDTVTTTVFRSLTSEKITSVVWP